MNMKRAVANGVPKDTHELKKSKTLLRSCIRASSCHGDKIIPITFAKLNSRQWQKILDSQMPNIRDKNKK